MARSICLCCMTACLLSFLTKTTAVSGNVLTSFAYLLKLHLSILNADAFINLATLLDSCKFFARTSSLSYLYCIFFFSDVCHSFYETFKVGTFLFFQGEADRS